MGPLPLACFCYRGVRRGRQKSLPTAFLSLECGVRETNRGAVGISAFLISVLSCTPALQGFLCDLVSG